MQIISIINQKGGVGKTTTVINLAAGLSQQNKKILVIDLDPQGNATTGLGLSNMENSTDTIYGVLNGTKEISEVIKKTQFENLDLITSNVDLSGLEVETAEDANRAFILKLKLTSYLNNSRGLYDYILIDCPPSLSLLTVMALVSSHSLVVPLQTEFFALEGLTQLMKTIERIKVSLNPELMIRGILLTMYDKRNKLSSQVEKEARDYFNEKVYSTVIPRNVRLSEAPSHGMPVLIYDKSCPGSKSYFSFTDEFINQETTIGSACIMDSNKIKKGLGRGLSSLIGETKVETLKNQLSISDLIPNKYQPRKIFDEDNLNDLTNSIKERGILQPIIVRKSNDDKSKFEIIAGERRWLAAQKAGLHTVPVVITEADDLKSLEFAIVENVQRHDLNPLEEAQGYKRLIDEFNYDQEKVSKFIGKSRSHITNSLRLLTLPLEVIKLIETQKLTAGHAKILVGLENSSFVANKIVEKKLSVRQAESFVKIFKNKRQKPNNVKDANIKDLEISVSNKIGLNVLIKNKKNNKGKITFEYKGLDQLNKIIDIIKSNY
jgi:chromosome partitioning protein